MRPNCRFRFPLSIEPENRLLCPKCGGPTKIACYEQLINNPQPASMTPPGLDIEVLFDNIRSAYNVGSMLRTSEAVGIRYIHFCGVTPTPDQKNVAKTALGTQFSTPWAQYWNSPQAVSNIKSRGLFICGLELTENSRSITDAIIDLNKTPILLIVGNEITGIDPEVLKQCDQIVQIPMIGQKQSLNVAIAYSVAVYLIKYSN
jgi:23S rRNA (guanosine2251-2'-O)-methyltransferase